MKFLDINASGHALGLALGQFGQAAVHQHLLPSPTWAQLQQHQGSAALRTMQQLTQQHFPWIWQEIEGLAQGLQLSVEDTFLWNCRGDLWAMAPDGCTSVQLPATASHSARLAHNEDGLPFFKPHCAIVRAQGPDGVPVASFAYPGSILGHTFSVSDHGVGITVNNIRTRMVPAGVPRMVLGRACMGLGSAQAVAQRLCSVPRAGGFHFSVLEAATNAITSVEFTAHRLSTQAITQPSVHANHLVHAAMQHHPQVTTNSSGFRQERAQAMLQAAAQAGDAVNPLAILGDQHNAAFPLLRTAADDSDDENTIATAHLQVRAGALHWAVHTDPRQPAVLQLANAMLLLP